jgi:hypothetical protein
MHEGGVDDHHAEGEEPPIGDSGSGTPPPIFVNGGLQTIYLCVFDLRLHTLLGRPAGVYIEVFRSKQDHARKIQINWTIKGEMDPMAWLDTLTAPWAPISIPSIYCWPTLSRWILQKELKACLLTLPFFEVLELLGNPMY